MNKGQISAADKQEAKKSFDKFLDWVEQYLACDKYLAIRWSAYSVWVAEVFYLTQSSASAKIDLTSAKIDLMLPLELQAYQLAQQIGNTLKMKAERWR